jgi:hypothetical protein
VKKFICKTVDQKTGLKYEFFIYNFLDYVNALAYGNRLLAPFLLETLFSDRSNVILSNDIGQILYRNRKKFLTPQCLKYFFQIAKRQFKGFQDTYTLEKPYTPLKQACHALRLLNECDEILKTNNFNTTQENRMIMRIRSNKLSFEQVEKICLKRLEKMENILKKLQNEDTSKFVQKLKLQGIYKYYNMS